MPSPPAALPRGPGSGWTEEEEDQQRPMAIYSLITKAFKKLATVNSTRGGEQEGTDKDLCSRGKDKINILPDFGSIL